MIGPLKVHKPRNGSGITLLSSTERTYCAQNGAGDGVLAFANSIAGCSFLENLIANNCGRALYISEGCTDNLAAQNKALRNGNDMIDDGTNNLFDDNTEFNNKLECNGMPRVARRAQVQVNLNKNSKSM